MSYTQKVYLQKAECKGVFLALQNQMVELTDVTLNSKCLLYTFLIILVSDNLLQVSLAYDYIYIVQYRFTFLMWA